MRGKLLVLARSMLGLGRPADVILIGGQRCGTRSLFNYLRRHPHVATAARAEVHYFDVNHDRGPRWYASHFSSRRGSVAVEASPYYLFHPHVPGRVAAELPDARFLVLLRDPVTRAYSHYQMMRDKQRETLSFGDALDQEDQRIQKSESAFRNFSYKSRGLYADQLERWFSFFPRERFHICISEEMFADGPAHVDRVCDFLGVPYLRSEEYTQWNARSYPRLPKGQEASLRAFYRAHNRRLAELLGRELPW